MDEQKFTGMVASIFDNMNNVIKDEEYRSEVDKIEAEDIDENFFIAEILALKLQFCKLTNNDDMDLVDFISTLNRLAIQYLLEHNKQDDKQA